MKRDHRELLSLLTTKVQSFENSASSFSKLTPQDIAHAIAKIHSPPARLYLRVKYADQIQFANELGIELLAACGSQIDEIGKWKIPRPGFLGDLCSLALFESINPHVCPWCQGRGEALIDSRVIVCDGCSGTGRRQMQDKDRAGKMNLSKSSWSELWSDRYKEIQRIIDIWEDLAAGALRKRLSESDEPISS